MGVRPAHLLEEQRLTLYSLAFRMHVGTTGTVLGIRPAGSPGRVTETLAPVTP